MHIKAYEHNWPDSFPLNMMVQQVSIPRSRLCLCAEKDVKYKRKSEYQQKYRLVLIN